MKYIFFLLLFSSSLSAQWNETSNCNQYVPPQTQDSLFAVQSDSREGIAECRGTWVAIPSNKYYYARVFQESTNPPDISFSSNYLGATVTPTRGSSGRFEFACEGLEEGATVLVTRYYDHGDAYTVRNLSARAAEGLVVVYSHDENGNPADGVKFYIQIIKQ